jgi:K+-transporting ATPase KdpF subunit
MSAVEIASGVVAIVLLGYLVYALLFAERF